MTTILFDATRTVKPATPRRFGAGIIRSVPTYRADHTASDAAWLAEQNSARSLDRRVDEMYEESEATRRLEAGLCC